MLVLSFPSLALIMLGETRRMGKGGLTGSRPGYTTIIE